MKCINCGYVKGSKNTPPTKNIFVRGYCNTCYAYGKRNGSIEVARMSSQKPSTNSPSTLSPPEVPIIQPNNDSYGGKFFLRATRPDGRDMYYGHILFARPLTPIDYAILTNLQNLGLKVIKDIDRGHSSSPSYTHSLRARKRRRKHEVV